MGQIKVERRSMRLPEWIDLRLSRLKKHIYSEKYEITSFTVREARQSDEMVFEFYDGEPRPLKRGDIYFTPDGTAFINAEFDVPKSFEGGEYRLLLKTAAEMIIKVNGAYAGGIDPNRETVEISRFVKDGHVKLEIVGYNRSKPDDERNPESLSVRGCRQIFEGGYLVKPNEKVTALIYDIELLTNAASCEIFGEDFSEHVYRELDRALNLIDFDCIDNEDIDRAREYIDEKIYSDKTYKGSGRVDLVAHSHLDIAYYWRRIHSVQKNMRTALIQLRLMDKYPDFKYSHTQAYTYETLEKYYPEVFEELRERVLEGRFEPVGGMYVEPDCNVPCAESLIRQLLYGQSFFRSRFGITVDNAWLPDVFGNSWIMPQILKKSGVNYFVSNKMSTWNDTNRFPHNNFIWKGIDGTEIYACVPPTHFISWNMPSQVAGNWEAFQDKGSGTATLQMFGYGDGGSGVTEEMIELMHRFDKLSVMPQTKHVTGGEFLRSEFTEEKELETWDDELYLEMHRGTLTTKAELKDYNRKAEALLREAELVSVLNTDKGVEYPADEIREYAKKLMVNQFHDILPGSHITPVYRDAVKDFKEIISGLENIIGEEGRYFNSLNFERKEITFIPDENGNFTRKGVKGRFVKADFPALSNADLPEGESGEWFKVTRESIETPFYSARLAMDGSILSLYDKELNREWVSGEFNTLKFYADTPGNYDAWDILPGYKECPVPSEVCDPLKLMQADGECAEFCALQKTGESYWCRIIRFFRSSREIEVENIVDWKEKNKLAKVKFTCSVLSRELVCDTSAGFIKRPANANTSWQKAKFEVCCHKWCDFSETDGGVAVINENKYGAGPEPDGFTLSLLRSPVRPDPTSDTGIHDFCYVICPHGGDHVEGEINKKALEYNTPLRKNDFEYVGDTFAPLILQAMKLSEDGSMVVYRLSEQDGRRGRIKLSGKMKTLNMLEDVIGETDEIEYSPFEIITLGAEI